MQQKPKQQHYRKKQNNEKLQEKKEVVKPQKVEKETSIKDEQKEINQQELQVGKLIKQNIVLTSTDERFFAYTHNALIGDLVSFKVLKASNGSRLANVQIVDIVKRGQRFYLAFITEYVESSNIYTVKIYGSDLTFQAPSANTFKEGDPCLITFTTKDQIEIIKDLGLYEQDEIVRSVFDIEELEYHQPFVSSVAESSTKDQTSLVTFTIDPTESKDFDDALSIDVVSSKIYIHIADVARYVSTNSRLDQRLKQRQFSVYLLHRVFHMSPHRLATDVCSLNPGVERFATTIEFAYDPTTLAIVPNSFLHYRSKILSKHRFNYDQVDEILRKTDGCNEQDSILKFVYNIFLKNKIIKTMKDNMPEIKTVGEKRHIQMYQPDDSHEMVEFYMLTANQYVASYLDAKGIVYPKRSHPKPIDICKFENICKLQLPNHCPKEFHVFLKLTCMQPACYTIDKQKVGHFALGMQYYTHFTSPIRRYIDIVNQRLLFEDYSYTPKELEDICKLANEEEMRNKRIDDLQSHLSDCAYARKHKHDRFRGIIYGLQPKVAMVYVVETMMTTQIDIKLFATSFKDFFVLHEHKWIGKRMSFSLYDEVALKILSIEDKVYYRPVRK